MESNNTKEHSKEPSYVKITEEAIPQEKKGVTRPMIIIGAVFALAVIVVGVLLYRRAFGASNRVRSLSDYFQETSGCAIIYQDSIRPERAVMAQEYYFLPLSFVTQVDDFYYYDELVQEILYARPTELVHYSVEEVSNLSDVRKEMTAFSYQKQVYLNASAFQENSYVVCQIYSEPNRILIFDRVNTPIAMKEVTKQAKLREDASKHSDILLTLSPGEQVYYLEEGSWTKVMSVSGVIGYMEEDALANGDALVHKLDRAPYEYTSISLDEPICLVWHQVFETTAPTQVSRFTNAFDLTKGVNVVSPTWFSVVAADGSIASLGDPEYTKAAHERGLSVWGLIDNFNKEVDNLTLLSGYPYRQKLITMLMDEAKRLDLDGINIDFEGNSSGYGGLNRDCGSHFIEFLRELSIECRKAGLVLSVDNHVPMDYNQYFHREQQAQVVDYVIIMGYDEHYGGGTPGSTASYDFVKNGIEKTLLQVPKEKVINAVPFYSRLWKMTPQDQATENATIRTESYSPITSTSPIGPYALSSSAKGAKAIASLIEEKELTLTWLDTEQQYYTEYESEGCYYLLWIEDTASMKKRMELSASYDLAGVACWKLGLESPNMWDVLLENLR